MMTFAVSRPFLQAVASRQRASSAFDSLDDLVCEVGVQTTRLTRKTVGLVPTPWEALTLAENNRRHRFDRKRAERAKRHERAAKSPRARRRVFAEIREYREFMDEDRQERRFTGLMQLVGLDTPPPTADRMRLASVLAGLHVGGGGQS